MIHYLLIGSACVLTIDSLGALIAKKFSFKYAYLTLLSFLTYVLLGYYVGKNHTPEHAAIVCGLVGLLDSTVGWRISWLIGPGKIEAQCNTKQAIVKTIFFITAIASAIGNITAKIT